MALLENLKIAFERVEAEGMVPIHAAEAEIMEFVDHIKQHLTRDPELVFAVLRRVKPVLYLKSKNLALVTRYDDVQEVLSRDDIFLVTYEQKMRAITGGPNFFLGMQNSPEYERDVVHMRTVIRREDIPSVIAPLVAKTAEELVAASSGPLDVVSQLSKIVPARWVAAYFGCPPPSEQELADWASVIFQYLFADLNNDPAVGKAANDAAEKVRSWLDQSIANRKAHPANTDDVLNRCLALQKAGVPAMDDLGIRNNLLGLLVGAIPTTSKCCAQALDELLKRPAELERAQAAAASNDGPLVAQYVFEALRFNPNNPGVFRIAAQDFTVAEGSMRETLIPKGTAVLAATQSAMFDDHVVDSPGEFRVGRSNHSYMHWGYGLHACFGQYINQVQIPGILKPLLRRKGLRRAAGDAGQLQYSGPFPSSLKVEYN